MARSYEPWERRLVAEYVPRAHPRGDWDFNVRLGGPPHGMSWERYTAPEQRALGGVFRRWVDALVRYPDRIVCVEGKMVLEPVALAELELYARLLPASNDYWYASGSRIELEAVYAVADPVIEAMGREKGIRMVLYRPTFYDTWLVSMAVQHRRASPALVTRQIS